MKYSYSIDDNGTMTIFADNKSVAEISECEKLDAVQKDTLVTEVLTDLGYEI